ncbi:5-aminolevulinate synthase [Roseovarius sp. THAF9]|uniref:5-aminolevulinate synthase n=1 Tax=Roseovarius sp. THAF9 TaxID=2587847 RepID=UPI0012694BC9|nr:5-aminolevulinate synthase [Roseovarius sp. THAF9]
METFDLRLLALAVFAAMGYALATIGMKLASGHWSFLAAGLILLGFIAATQTEILLMRGVSLGALYLLIIAIETLVVLTYAYAIGEGLSARDVGGGVLILLGVALVSH